MKRTLLGVGAALVVAIGVFSSAARAATHSYLFNLNGASENPANGSAGTGSGSAVYDDVAHTLALNLTFSGLTGTTTASHLHAVTATSGLGGDAAAAAVLNVGVATTTPTFAGFPLGVKSGVFANVLDLTQSSSWNAAFVTAQGSIANAETALAGALASGKTYWNVHTTDKPGGEIRGFPVPVPEPAAAVLAAVGLATLVRRRK